MNVDKEQEALLSQIKRLTPDPMHRMHDANKKEDREKPFSSKPGVRPGSVAHRMLGMRISPHSRVIIYSYWNKIF